MFKKAPNIWQLSQLIKSTTETQCSSDGVFWYPARPIGWSGGFNGLKRRFKFAWLVFSGKADAVIWPGNQ